MTARPLAATKNKVAKKTEYDGHAKKARDVTATALASPRNRNGFLAHGQAKAAHLAASKSAPTAKMAMLHAQMAMCHQRHMVSLALRPAKKVATKVAPEKEVESSKDKPAKESAT